MSVYPFELDDDTTLPRVDDNITETGQEAINALRDSVFNVEETLGIEPNGSAGTVASRLDASLNADGTIKASALASIGLVTLPITNNQVGTNAGIEESKLSLIHSTTDLYTLIVAANALINSVNSLAVTTFADLNLHISGATYLSDGSSLARHVLSQIDLNTVPSDTRDPLYVWTGLLDKDGNLRAGTTAAEGLLAVNNALTSHENQALDAHPASAISVNTDAFIEIPLTATDAQSVFNYLDQAEILNMGQHRATQHANAIPKISRSDVIGLDGYGHNVVPATSCLAYLTHPPNTTYVDDLSVGDDIIKFSPDNTANKFDALFSQVRVGDIIRINYANGLEASYPVESIRFTPELEWIVRINGSNLCESSDGYAVARIDRSLYDVDTAGIFAVAYANARNSAGPTATTNLSSLIVSDPRGAMALGLNFDANQLNSTHYNLYLEFYPNGNPTDKVVSLPAIDVTGNAGATPGKYTLSSIVDLTNNKLREFGYNYRFIAFEHNGEFGIMLADSINNASFAIVNGSNSSGTLSVSSYTNNVIGINSDTFDALGFGLSGANIASPAYQSTWTDATSAQIPTKVIRPLKKRYAIVNGNKIDKFADMYLTVDGYWDGYISDRTVVGLSTVETTYTIESYLAPSGLRAGKTIVIQPAIEFTDPLYSDVDYGRFIIKDVNFIGACGSSPALTLITVINSIHGVGSPTSSSAAPSLPVKLYFSYDSVDFNYQNLIDSAVTSTDYKRFHEIYLTDLGKTFSHERLRMPIQLETASPGGALSTNYFHVVDVSPKLRGYTDGSPLVFNKYLRFYVLNYDSTTGEYDGYLGQKDTSYNIKNTGQIVTGKKGVVTRFYDETNIDYVDLVFDGSPGVMTTSEPRYVDLELFSSLRTDDELFLLATCEVNWDPLSNENIIQYLNNRRQFGSIDELDFTESAKDYISAADKYLHDNGVIRGLDYSADLGNGEIKFHGGSAIVNGKVVVANNQSVTIPQIYKSGGPNTVDWAVCLNEDGNLIPIVLTASKVVFTATDGVTTYQVPSVTFNELINERKNLCLISVINVTIASITVNSITDARKFVHGLDLSAPLVLSSGSDYLASFYSIESLKYWINNSNNKNNVVKLKGDFNLTSNLDLSGFTKKVIFDGIDASFTIDGSTQKCVQLGSNIQLENWDITYLATDITAPGVTTTLTSGSGCFYFAGGNVSNVKIKNCTFTSSDAYGHYPFINFEFDRGNVLENIIIENNTFDVASEAGDIAFYQAAISFLSVETVGATASILKNIIIKDNYSKKEHAIYLTRDNIVTTPGVRASGIIENNTVGKIGYFFGTSGADAGPANYGLIIKNNFVKLIGTFLKDEPYTYANPAVSIGPVLIEGNTLTWLKCILSEASSNKTSLIVKNNTFIGDDDSYLDFTLGSYSGSPDRNSAIQIINQNLASPTYNRTVVLIDGNIVDFGIVNSVTYGYDRCLSLQGKCNVTNNIFAGINSGEHIVEIKVALYSEDHYYVIENNDFIRRANSISSYMLIDETGTSGRITNNRFDSDTIDGSSDTLILRNVSGVLSGDWSSLYKWFVYGNKNQKGAIYLNISNSNLSFGPGDPTGNITGAWTPFASNGAAFTYNSYVEADPTSTILVFNYSAADTNSMGAILGASLNSILPEGCTVTSAELRYTSSANLAAGISSIQLTYQQLGSLGLSTSITNWATGVNTLTLTIPSGGLIKRLPSSAVASAGISSGIYSSGNSVLCIKLAADAPSNTTLTFYLRINFKW